MELPPCDQQIPLHPRLPLAVFQSLLSVKVQLCPGSLTSAKEEPSPTLAGHVPKGPEVGLTLLASTVSTSHCLSSEDPVPPWLICILSALVTGPSSRSLKIVVPTTDSFLPLHLSSMIKMADVKPLPLCRPRFTF